MIKTTENLLDEARSGNIEALESLVKLIQPRIYNLAGRMLANIEDAQDATQEILVKIITHLNSFRGASAFETWAYRIAANHLLTTRKRREELREVTFEQKAEIIDFGLSLGETLSAPLKNQPDEELFAREIKITCTQGMLMCLDREHRLALILGEVFEVSSDEAAEILQITSVAYRQRLTRARRKLGDFMQAKCGLVNPANPCRCHKQIPASLHIKKLDPKNLYYTSQPQTNLQNACLELRELDRVSAVFRSHPGYTAPNSFIEAVRTILTQSTFNQ